jgi:hypothetical protein
MPTEKQLDMVHTFYPSYRRKLKVRGSQFRLAWAKIIRAKRAGGVAQAGRASA